MALAGHHHRERGSNGTLWAGFFVVAALALIVVAMLALDEFVLWVNAESPYKTAAEYVAAVKAGENGKFKMAGTGSKQEDQIITVALEKATGKKFTYVPFKGGGDVAVQLVGKHVDSTVNNPIEAIAHWRSGALRPLCVFDTKPMPYPNKVTSTMSWQDIPTCKTAGLDVEYVMLRDVNDSEAEARELVRLLAGIPAKVNLIPFNPWPGSPYRTSTYEQTAKFAAIVNAAGYSSPIRRPRGRDILAACGQLKTETERLRKSAVSPR